MLLNATAKSAISDADDSVILGRHDILLRAQNNRLGHLGDTRPLLIGGTVSQWFFRMSLQEEDDQKEVHPP